MCVRRQVLWRRKRPTLGDGLDNLVEYSMQRVCVNAIDAL